MNCANIIIVLINKINLCCLISVRKLAFIFISMAHGTQIMFLPETTKKRTITQCSELKQNN